MFEFCVCITVNNIFVLNGKSMQKEKEQCGKDRLQTKKKKKNNIKITWNGQNYIENTMLYGDVAAIYSDENYY